MPDLVIASTTIRRDTEGRYSLNDLHRASGGEAKHQPAFWLRNAQTQALVVELNNSANLQSSPVSSQEGHGGGTYVAEPQWLENAFYCPKIWDMSAIA